MSNLAKNPKQNISLFIKIGANLVKRFSEENDPLAKLALDICVKKTRNEKDKSLIEDFINSVHS